MKGVLSSGRHGFSTLEILIASSVVTLTLTTAVALLHSNIWLLADARTTLDALALSHSQLVEAAALGTFDTKLLSEKTGIEVRNGQTYTTKLSLSSLSPFMTEITSTVTWHDVRDHTVTLKRSVSDIDSAFSGTACDTVALNSWHTIRKTALLPLGTYTHAPISGFSMVGNLLYVTHDNSAGNNPDLTILNTTTLPLTLVAATGTNSVSPGLAGISIARTTQDTFLFVANGATPNWSTCTEGPSCSHVQVLTANDALQPKVVRNIKIPEITGTGGQGSAHTIAVYRKHLFVGLTKTGSGPEFHVFDIGRSPGASATSPKHLGSLSVGRGIQHILPVGEVAYLATSDNTRELMVVSITDPQHPSIISIVDTPGSTNFGYGNTLARLGNTVSLGRTYVGNASEWYTISMRNPAHPTTLSATDIGTTQNPQSVQALFITAHRTLLVATNTISLWDTASTTPLLLLSLPLEGVSATAAMCHNTRLYVGGLDATGRSVLLVLEGS